MFFQVRIDIEDFNDIKKYQKALDEKDYAQQKICLASMPFLKEWPSLERKVTYKLPYHTTEGVLIVTLYNEHIIQIIVKDWTPLACAALGQDQEAVDIALEWVNHNDSLIQRSLAAIRNAIDGCINLDKQFEYLAARQPVFWRDYQDHAAISKITDIKKSITPTHLRNAGKLICMRAFEGENHEHDFDLSLSKTQKAFFEHQLVSDAEKLDSIETLVSFYNENFKEGFIGSHTRLFSYSSYPDAKKEFVYAVQRRALRLLAELPEAANKPYQAHGLQQAGIFDEVHFKKGGVPDHLLESFKKVCPENGMGHYLE